MLAAGALGLFFAAAVLPLRRGHKVFAGLSAILFALGYALLLMRYRLFDMLVLFGMEIGCPHFSQNRQEVGA